MDRDYRRVSELLQERGMWRVYELELSVVPLLVVMECKGLRVDLNELDRVDRLMSVSAHFIHLLSRC